MKKIIEKWIQEFKKNREDEINEQLDKHDLYKVMEKRHPGKKIVYHYVTSLDNLPKPENEGEVVICLIPA
jgi:hypothetical protein